MEDLPLFAGPLNLRASEPCEPRCERCESCESCKSCKPFLRVFFFSIGLGVRRLFTKKHRSRAQLSLNYRYKLPARPPSWKRRWPWGRVQPRSQDTLPFPEKLILKLATKVPTTEIFPKENPNLASVTRTIAGAANMKNALNICTSCQVLHHSNGCPECDEFFLCFTFLFFGENFVYSNRPGSAKNKNNASKIY